MQRRRTADIASKVERGIGLPGLVAALAELPGSELHPLLLELYQGRAARVTVPELLAAAARPLFTPSTADARLLHRFDGLALAEAGQFEAVELSPVEPAGANAVLAGVHTNNVLGALRSAEVLADPTVALALHSAHRRREPGARRATVRLCASQRCVRMQAVDAPGFTQHFRLFALTTAGRDSGEHRFEVAALQEHVAFYLRLLRAAKEAGFRVQGTAVEISDVEAVAAVCAAAKVDVAEVRRVARAHRIGEAAAELKRRGVTLPAPEAGYDCVLAKVGVDVAESVRLRLARVRHGVGATLAAEFPDVPLRFDLGRLEGLGYYDGLCFRIRVDGPIGPAPVIDGGFTSWTQRLLADRKERFLSSAIGSEFLCKMYAP